MKMWIFTPIIVLLFLQSPAAMAQRESLLLTEREFMALTFSEQKHYIKKVREIIVEMSENNPYLVSELAKRSKFFALLWGGAIPPVSAEEDKTKTTPSQFQIVEMIKKFSNNSRLYSTEISSEINKAQSKDPKLLDAYLNQALISAKVAAYLIKNKIDDAALKTKMESEILTPIIKLAEEAQNNMKKINPEGRFTKKSDQEIMEIKNGTLGSLDLTKVDVLITPYEDHDKFEAQPDKKTFYRCMYAGFVIKGTKDCLGLQKIPWQLTGIKIDNYVCENDTKMCNPLIFGVDVSGCQWTTAVQTPDETEKKKKIDGCLQESKPFCTPRSRTATKNCADLSNSAQALEAAVLLIKHSETNRKAMTAFSADLKALCQESGGEGRSQKTIKDIKTTCKQAESSFNKLREKYSEMFPPPKKLSKPDGSAR